MKLLAFDSHPVEAHLRRLPLVVRHLTATIERLDLQSQELPTSYCAASDAQAWLLRRLRWEHRLTELRADHERSRHNDDRSTLSPSA